MAAFASSLALAAALAASPPPPDGQVTTSTRLKLVTSPDLNGLDVKVDTIDGKVTLFGGVWSDAERDAATAIAKAVPGVTAVRNLLVPRAQTPAPRPPVDDDALGRRVRRALEQDAGVEASDVRVRSVKHGVVRLSGQAPTPSDLLRVASTARAVDGVRQVVVADVKAPERFTEEELRLKAPVRPSLDDERTTTEVKLSLLTSDAPLGTDINVDSSEGKVTLFGTVASSAALEAAALEAEDVEGVTGVENRLVVVPELVMGAVSRRDVDVKAAVATALSGRPELAEVDFEVADSVARLTGQVPDVWARLRAVRLALGVPGIARVQQAIEVGPKAQALEASRR